MRDLKDTMSTMRQIHWTGVFCFALIPCIAVAQTVQKNLRNPPPTAKEIADALKRLRQGAPFLVDIAQLAQAGVVAAIPDLEKQFAVTQDQTTKGAAARALVKLGDKDPSYWDYLVREATVAIDSDEPFPLESMQMENRRRGLRRSLRGGPRPTI